MSTNHEQEAKIAATEATEALAICRSVGFDTPLERDAAADMLRAVKAQGKRYKARKEEITKPLQDALASVRALFRPVEQAYDTMESELKAGIAAGLLAEERAAMAAISAAAGDPAAVAVVAVPSKPDGLSVRKLPRVRVVDVGVAPRKFLSVDTAAVLAAVKAGEIVPGVEIYYETSIASRGT